MKGWIVAATIELDGVPGRFYEWPEDAERTLEIQQKYNPKRNLRLRLLYEQAVVIHIN